MIYVPPEDAMTPVIKELHDRLIAKSFTPRVVDRGSELIIESGAAFITVSHWSTVTWKSISVDVCVTSGMFSSRVASTRCETAEEVVEFINQAIPNLVSDLSNLHALFKEEA